MASSSTSSSASTSRAGLMAVTMALLASSAVAHPSAPAGNAVHHRDVGRIVARQSSTSSAVVPIAPGPGSVFREGQTCTTEWTPTTNSSWNSFTIELMTGSNYAMKSLAVVKTGIDGTDSTNTYLDWPCPSVDPYGAIYFYQYTLADGSEPTWTTRFTIADENGQVESPAHTTVISGTTVAYGSGKLVSAETQSAVVGSSASESGSSGSGSSASGSVTSAAATATATGSTSSSSSQDQADDQSSSSSSDSTSSSSASSNLATAQSQNTSSGAASQSVLSGAVLLLTGALAGAAALVL